MRAPTNPGPAVKPARKRIGKAVAPFKPGDLITAEALNAIVAAVNQLADRVAALEKRCR